MGSGRPSSAAVAAGMVAMSACLLAPALFNRYPLVTPDTGTYLHSSFTWGVPSDRPVFYGLFLGATHLGRTPWTSIAAQAVIVAAVLTLLLRVLLPGRGLATAVVVAAVLAATTSLPWFVGQLSPDVFAALLVVSLYLVAVDDAPGWHGARAFALVCLVVAIMVHGSHLLLVIGLAGALQLGWRRHPRPGLRRVWQALAAAVVATLVGNVVLAGKPVLARGSHAFLMGRLIEDGIMEVVLDERCGTTAYRLCAFRAELPMTADEYLWAPNALLQRTGGWKGSKGESSRLIAAAVVTHPVRVARGALASFLHQLVTFRTDAGLVPPPPGSWVEHVMAERFPAEQPRYHAARQHQGTLVVTGLATFHQWTVVAAIALIAGATLAGRAGTWSSFAAYVGAALVVNAAVTGALSGVHDRYQSRLIWLVVLTALVAVIETFSTSQPPPAAQTG